MSIQRNQSVVCYTIIPRCLAEMLDLFMCASEVDRDSFRRMKHFYKFIETQGDDKDLNNLKMWLIVEKIDPENAWIQFW